MDLVVTVIDKSVCYGGKTLGLEFENFCLNQSFVSYVSLGKSFHFSEP